MRALEPRVYPSFDAGDGFDWSFDALDRDPSFDSGTVRTVASLLAGLIAAGAAIDLALDRPATLWSFHVWFELGTLVVSLATLVWLLSGLLRASRSLERAARTSARHQAERDEWRKRAEKLLVGLGEAIDDQLRRWELTPAERETALLLLKGLGFKEIAAVQQRSERTVRQHAIAVYRKSGLAGRAEFAAFFLEDLLLPPQAAAAPGREGPGASFAALDREPK